MTAPSDAIEEILRHATQVDSDFCAMPGVRAFALGGQFALFHEARQELVELNATATAIWRCLLDTRTLSGATSELSEFLGANNAWAYLRSAAAEWIEGGWITLTAVVSSLAGDPDDSLTLSVLDVGLRINAYNCAIPSGILSALAELATEADRAVAIDIVAVGQAFFLFAGLSFRGVFDQTTLMPAVKATLTALVADSELDGFLAHGALVECAGRRAYFLGGPGAGKSTLTAALAQSRIDVLSDDIVQIDCGSSRGAPFPITLKTGSWTLLDDLAGIASLPTYRRADGQDVRYLTGHIIKSDWMPLNLVVALKRVPGAMARLEPLSPLEAMKMLLASSYTIKRRVSAKQVSSLADAFAAIRCSTLVFSELPEAVELITKALEDAA